MKKGLLIILFLLMGETIISQTKIEFLNSNILETRCAFSIKLPDDYNKNNSETYPIILVFDSEYLLQPVIGQYRFQAYLETMPKSIIVGIDGSETDSESKYNDFIEQELIRHLDTNYNTSGFRVAVGHGKTGQTLNSFLLKDEELFQAYVNLSTVFSEDNRLKITQNMELLSKDIIYYLATATNDIPSKRANLLLANAEFQQISNRHFKFYFDDFEQATEHTLVTRGIAKAFEIIFQKDNISKSSEKKENVISYENILEKD